MEDYFKLVINAYSLIILIIISLVFFLKKRMHKPEDNLYSMILVTGIATIFSGILLGIVISTTSVELTNFLIIFLNRIYMIGIILMVSLFAFYTFYVSKKDKGLNLKKWVWALKIFNVINALIMFALPLSIKFENGVMSTNGLIYPYSFLLLTCIYILMSIFVVLDIKNIKQRKYIPILLLIVLSSILNIASINYPQVNFLMNPAFVINIMIMYFTIENPDVKMISTLELAKEQAEKANRAKSDFLSSMSHEIRTPLNAIVGLSNNILEIENLSSNLKEDAKDIVDASNTLLEIVGNILDISKIESGKLDIITAPYSFKDELESTFKINKVRLEGKTIDYKLSIAEDIPYKLIGDRIHIKEILNNLISNAIKYTNEGTINVDAKCINRDDDCMLIISVKDTGRGIKKENIEKLFNRFQRLDIEKETTVEGTGLGLAITKNLVEMMGGTINVQSKFGQGSLFVVQIPQKISMLNKPKAQKIIRKSIQQIINFENKKVLIVDDNPLNLKVAQKVLDDFHFNITTATSGDEALDLCRNNVYDVILMDIMMPGKRGDEVFLELKKMTEFNTPVIALTADAVSDSEKKYLDLGFDDYIAKPFTKDEIKEKLERLIS